MQINKSQQTIIEMKDLEALAEKVKTELNIEYNSDGVKFIEGFIERQKFNFSGRHQQGLMNSLAAFIGQAIIKNYGGYWCFETHYHTYCIAFDAQNKVYPFNKVKKQFRNGLNDSVSSFYNMIPVLFKLKPNNDPVENTNNKKNKTWWKFWQ
jgi:hypothetical protein